jgi:hypothetical protein
VVGDKTNQVSLDVRWWTLISSSERSLDRVGQSIPIGSRRVLDFPSMARGASGSGRLHPSGMV